MRKLLYALFYVSWTLQETLIKKKNKNAKTHEASQCNPNVYSIIQKEKEKSKKHPLKVIKAV